MELDEIILSFEPVADFGRFVVLCVVGNQVDLGPAVVAKELLQELDERLGIEHFYETRMPLGVSTDPDGAHYLDALANRWTEDVDSNADECPRPDDSASLLKHRFVLVEHYPSFLFGFFLMAGRSSSRHVR